MITTIQNIPAQKVSEELARRGVQPDQKVTVLVREDMIAMAREIREEARRRGMTDQLLAQLLEELKNNT